MKEIEQRVQSLSGVLASPMGENDYAEKARRVELRRYVSIRTYINLLIPLRKLEAVLMKLEPLSDQHAIAGFLRNIDDAKRLTGFIQELANAIMDYQVRAAGSTVIFNEHLSRFRYNRGCMRERETSLTAPRILSLIPRTF